jgi:hypothetical protein
MPSTKENFLLTLSLSDEGLKMIAHRIRRDNPTANKEQLKQLMRKELVRLKKNSLPSYLKPIYNV